jgi:hypothetical protein
MDLPARSGRPSGCPCRRSSLGSSGFPRPSAAPRSPAHRRASSSAGVASAPAGRSPGSSGPSSATGQARPGARGPRRAARRRSPRSCPCLRHDSPSHTGASRRAASRASRTSSEASACRVQSTAARHAPSGPSPSRTAWASATTKAAVASPHTGLGCVRLLSCRASSAADRGAMSWAKIPSGLARISEPFAWLAGLAWLRSAALTVLPTSKGPVPSQAR